MITAVILAAGTSSRMGKENKLMLPYKKESILRHIILTLEQTRVERILVVLGHEADQVRTHLSDLTHGRKVQTIVNKTYEKGMCSSFQTGVAALERDAVSGVVLFLGDQPLVSPEAVDSLITAFESDTTGTKVFIVSHKGKKGHPAIFHPDTIPDILAIPEDGTIREVVHRHQTAATKIEADDGVIKDVDTKEDYQRHCLARTG